VALPPASPRALSPGDGSILRLRRALEQAPGDRELGLALARAMAAQGRFREAMVQAARLLEEEPGSAEARFLLAWGTLGAGEEGAPELLEGLPEEADRCRELAGKAADLGHFEITCRLLARAAALQPGDAGTALKHAIALDYAGRFQDSLAELDELATRFAGDPANLAQVRFHQATTLLLLGHLEEGFRLMESRLALAAPKPMPMARWQGGPLAGRRLFLRPEQGYGDLFMFLRYVPWLAAQGAEVHLEAYFSAQAVCATCPGLRGVLEGELALPADTLQVEMGSLPLCCGTGADRVPAPIPYLSVPAQVPNRAALAEAIQGPGRRLGLVWAGHPGHLRTHERNLPPELLELLEAVPDATWFSLQKGGGPRPGLPMVDLAPLLDDYADTAFALSRLDGLISVDTGVVHLAGAMGVPTWVLLPALPDWRWQLERTDSPWYPGMRLWRQTRHWDWPEVMERVVSALAGPGAFCSSASRG